jgi:hypothetical protein
MPIVWVKKKILSRILHRHESLYPNTESDRKDEMVTKIRSINRAFFVMLMLPCAVFWATILASLERTPLTGRCFILLSSIATSPLADLHFF